MTLLITSETLARIVLAALADVALPTEEEAASLVDQMGSAMGASSEVRGAALRTVLSMRLVRMPLGCSIQEQHTPWVDARRPTISPYFWARYKQLLTSQLPQAVVSTMDRTTDDILDLCGNPEDASEWKRRGLVMGDVQSGKTANYSGLICKASDAGYRLIVLLTGTIESLRKQTQERLDENFCGLDSSKYLAQPRARQVIGVGRYDATHFPAVFTSSTSDFRAQTLNNLGLGLATLNQPALLVIKKHAKILNNLREWLESTNLGRPGDRISLPLLVIDDEADNASLNTNDEDSNPTRINERIRQLLALFQRSTYVGFTATPFANIFVNPDGTDDEVLGDDLFPRDFIYSLGAPSNYFGAKAMFRDENAPPTCLRTIADIEPCLPATHKSTAQVGPLPQSLIEALNCFALCNTIRDIRSEGATHRTMMVNISPYTNVQSLLESRIHDELTALHDSIRNFAGVEDESEALKDPRLAALKATWDREYADGSISWGTIQANLLSSVLRIRTQCVNQRTGPGALDYRSNKANGLRVIAVGGNSLSRGLTLEGLCVSYFRRTTKMYDTLLQMGRWFGYRPGYEDLCRVWLPADAADWYGHISDAADELRQTLVSMRNSGRTPKDFGLAVRAHPGSLLVTARNKMRRSHNIERLISLDGLSSESVELLPTPDDIKFNRALGNALIHDALAQGCSTIQTGTALVLNGVPKASVTRLLRQFRTPQVDVAFQPQAVADLLDSCADTALDYWDIGIPSGEGEALVIGEKAIQLQRRGVLTQAGNPPTIVVSGSNRRVGSRGVEKLGLTEEQIAAAERDALKEARDNAEREGRPAPDRVNTADTFYRAVRTRPLLVLHFLAPEVRPGNGPEIPPLISPILAIGMSFPASASGATPRRVRYVINTVLMRSMLPSDEEDIEDDVLELSNL